MGVYGERAVLRAVGLAVCSNENPAGFCWDSNGLLEIPVVLLGFQLG